MGSCRYRDVLMTSSTSLGTGSPLVRIYCLLEFVRHWCVLLPRPCIHTGMPQSKQTCLFVGRPATTRPFDTPHSSSSSTGEVENVLAADEWVAEAAVVPRDHELKGQLPVAFVICRKSAGLVIDGNVLRRRLNQQVCVADLCSPHPHPPTHTHTPPTPSH